MRKRKSWGHWEASRKKGTDSGDCASTAGVDDVLPPLHLLYLHNQLMAIVLQPSALRLDGWCLQEVLRPLTAGPWPSSCNARVASPSCLLRGSGASRHQMRGLRVAVGAPAHQQILRRLFWLRLRSGIQIGTFRVSSEDNPADPVSTLKALPSWEVAQWIAEECRHRWSTT